MTVRTWKICCLLSNFYVLHARNSKTKTYLLFWHNFMAKFMNVRQFTLHKVFILTLKKSLIEVLPSFNSETSSLTPKVSSFNRSKSSLCSCKWNKIELTQSACGHQNKYNHNILVDRVIFTSRTKYSEQSLNHLFNVGLQSIFRMCFSVKKKIKTIW